MDDTLQRVPNKDVHGFDLPTPEEGLAEAKRRLARIFRPSVIMSEYVGVGIGPTQDLEAMNLGYQIRRFNPSTEKAEAYGNLKSVIERGHIALPASDGYSSWHLQGTSGRCEAGRVRACRAIRA